MRTKVYAAAFSLAAAAALLMPVVAEAGFRYT
jgi:hypothetical protein